MIMLIFLQADYEKLAKQARTSKMNFLFMWF